MNLTIFGGNLSRDPEMRVTPSGTSVCNFAVANNRTRKGNDGQELSEVTFLDVEAWQGVGEVIQKYFLKGDPIIVRGHLKMDQWEDKQSGQKRSKLRLVIVAPAGGFDFCGKTSGTTGGSSGGGEGYQHDDAPRNQAPQNQQRPPAQQQQPPRRPPPQASLDEDVPF